MLTFLSRAIGRGYVELASERVEFLILNNDFGGKPTNTHATSWYASRNPAFSSGPESLEASNFRGDFRVFSSCRTSFVFNVWWKAPVSLALGNSIVRDMAVNTQPNSSAILTSVSQFNIFFSGLYFLDSHSLQGNWSLLTSRKFQVSSQHELDCNRGLRENQPNATTHMQS